jgi:transposase
MIRRGFLSEGEREELLGVARDQLCEARIARRANTIILLDKGWTYAEVAEAFLLDSDTPRIWHKLYEDQGLTGLVVYRFTGGHSHLTQAQAAAVFDWVRQSLPSSTAKVGAWIAETFGVDYSRPGVIALMSRLGLVYRKPKLVRPQLDPRKQRVFIDAYEKLLRDMTPDEAVVFADAVHPTHQVRPAGCWASKDEDVAISPSSGRERLNVHGAVDLETGRTQMIDVLTVDAASTIALFAAILAANPDKRVIHVFLDNARYHHAKMVKAWLKSPQGRRIKLHFVPPYCPHLNPIERLWGLMHKNITHNKGYATFREFAAAMLTFLRHTVPRNWSHLRDAVTDNFRVIDPTDFRIAD